MADTPAADDGLCQEKSGFLFSHPCDRFAMQSCARCQKRICNEHSHEADDGAVCTTCAKRGPSAPETTTGKPNPQRTNSPVGTSRPYYDDPYFYGSTWYPGYGYQYGMYGNRRSHRSNADTSDTGNDFDSGSDNDPNDFTEGDAESLRQEGDNSFEAEMGES